MYSKIIGRAPSGTRRQARVTCYFSLIHTSYTESDDEMRGRGEKTVRPRDLKVNNYLDRGFLAP